MHGQTPRNHASLQGSPMTTSSDNTRPSCPMMPSFGADKPGQLTYGDYLKVPELLALQKLRVEGKSHDELLFIIIHQTYELWFRQILHELSTAQLHMRCGQLRDATRLIERVNTIGDLLVDQLDVLATMRPRDFGHFREALRPASGFQSAQFRELEIVCNVLDPHTLRFFDEGTSERKSMDLRLQQPNLVDDLIRVLAHAGFDVLNADNTRKDDEEIALAIVPIYRDVEDWRDLYDLAEALVRLDNWVLSWRFRHVRVVERIIGFKSGTGGSPGVSYLNSTVGRRGCQFLIECRSHLDESELFGAYRPPICE